MRALCVLVLLSVAACGGSPKTSGSDSNGVVILGPVQCDANGQATFTLPASYDPTKGDNIGGWSICRTCPNQPTTCRLCPGEPGCAGFGPLTPSTITIGCLSQCEGPDGGEVNGQIEAYLQLLE